MRAMGAMEPIYLDHAATTPVRREVLEAMLPFYGERFGNPSSAHGFGRAARAGLEAARDRIAAALGAKRSEIFFTSGGTESDNLAVLGRVHSGLRQDGPASVACSAVEHKAVLSAARHAATEGTLVILIGVDGEARLDLAALDEALRQRPAVVSVMWVNNEVGTIQPVAEIAQRCAAADVIFHTDAVQAFGRLDVHAQDGISLLSISGHKLGAPKGIGALFVREGVALVAGQHGGSQERGLRPGTENIAAAVGLATAVELAAQERAAEVARLAALRDKLQKALTDAVPDLVVNGGCAARVPHILNVSVPDADQDALLVSLDLEGVAVSTASACQSGAAEPSHVLVAMGKSMENAAVMRVSLGRTTTDAEIDRAGAVIPEIIRRVTT
ncbi:MAG: cysteine desulfurase family protein [Gemmatimonadota bacterium]